MAVKREGSPPLGRVCKYLGPTGFVQSEHSNPPRARPQEETYSAAVKTWVELTQMALMGLSWPLSSPTGTKVSTFQSFKIPPLQPLSKTGWPGTRPRAQTQSLCAFGTCWERREKAAWKRNLSQPVATPKVVIGLSVVKLRVRDAERSPSYKGPFLHIRRFKQ